LSNEVVLELNSDDTERAKDRHEALPSQSDWAAPFEARNHRLIDPRACFEVGLGHETTEPDLPDRGAHCASNRLLGRCDCPLGVGSYCPLGGDNRRRLRRHAALDTSPSGNHRASSARRPTLHLSSIFHLMNTYAN